MTENATPKQRRPRKSEVPFSFLPKGNTPALIAYVCFLIGLLPGLGVLTGWVAGILGLVGYVKSKRMDPPVGLGHSFVSMILGPVEFVCHGLGLSVLL